jgi:hypothetical protein
MEHDVNYQNKTFFVPKLASTCATALSTLALTQATSIAVYAVGRINLMMESLSNLFVPMAVKALAGFSLNGPIFTAYATQAAAIASGAKITGTILGLATFGISEGVGWYLEKK